MFIFVKENVSFHSLIDISLQILLIPFFKDTLSFLYNVNKDISSVFSLKYNWFMPTDGISFGKYLVLLTMINFNMSE